MTRVLVLEEDPDLGGLFELLLESEGHEVVLIRDADEAEATLRAGDFSLVILELPAQHRTKAALTTWRARLREVAPSARVILCTCMPNLTRTSSVVAGFEGYLAMPFDLEEALAEVNRVLASQPMCCCSKGDPSADRSDCA